MLKNITLITVFTIAIAGCSNNNESSIETDNETWLIENVAASAPSFISDFATILDADGVVLREGSNGWSCLPMRPMPEGGYPDAQDMNSMCADEEGFKWAEAYGGGTTPNMERDAYIWMLNGDVGEDNRKSSLYGGDKEESMMEGHFIESGPHLMLMPKDPSTIENFPTDFTTGAPYQMFKGSPYAHLMIPVDGYYMFQPESAPK